MRIKATRSGICFDINVLTCSNPYTTLMCAIGMRESSFPKWNAALYFSYGYTTYNIYDKNFTYKYFVATIRLSSCTLLVFANLKRHSVYICITSICSPELLPYSQIIFHTCLIPTLHNINKIFGMHWTLKDCRKYLLVCINRATAIRHGNKTKRTGKLHSNINNEC